ncbi:MAG TPA: ABC transporter permease [Candidatus Sulfopaludibacter sp.]|jgi:putative ABC transport system permease protein|nr:ABC transporter permease [Candidatus Sulfopaludibacter sp.]
MLFDLRYAFRTLAKSPAFSTIAILALALGIGANTAIFSVVNAVLLKPLPYRDASRLVLVQERIPKIASTFFSASAPDVLDMARWTRTLDSVAGFEGRRVNFSAGTLEPGRLTGARISANLIPTLGIAPLLGRTFAAEEDAPGHDVILLSYGLWRDRFGADTSVTGRRVQLDGRPYTVIGVMPAEFVFPPRGTPQTLAEPAQFWVPMAFTQEELADVVDNFDIGVVGHLRPGVSMPQVAGDMTSLSHQIQAKYPQAYKDGLTLDIAATPLAEIVSGPARPVLVMLLSAVGFVLLIACANIANLLLSRAAGRRQEMAIRTALGASRLRMLRQVLTESLLLGISGGLAGVTLAWLTLGTFVATLPASIPHSQEITLDPRVLAFAAGLSLLTGLLFGSVPALSNWRGAVGSALRETTRGTTAGTARHRLRNSLVVCEIALSLVLLMGAGLLVRSYASAISTDPGFRPQHVLSFAISLPKSQYPPERVPRFFEALNAKLYAIPGVRAAGAGNFVPTQGSDWNRTFMPENWHTADGRIPLGAFTPVSGEFLQALGTPLRRGRYFTAADRRGSPPVVIVSENLARRYWPNQDPIGKRLHYGSPDNDRPWATIVGVVADTKTGSLEVEPLPHSYQPLEQLEDGAVTSLSYMIRTETDLASVAASVHRAVAALDPTLPLANLRTMQDVVDQSLAPRRFSTLLVGLFAALALFLAVLGIYGVIAFAVTQRTQEIGIRMALGAKTGDVLRLFLREGFTMALTGILIGSVAALLLGRYIATLLYGIKPTDIVTLAAAGAILAATALTATYIPARRAMRLDPMLALRHQ